MYNFVKKKKSLKKGDLFFLKIIVYVIRIYIDKIIFILNLFDL